MGYFDALISSSFKATPDGRWLFFPWGMLGGAYRLASEEDYGRLRRQVKTYLMVFLPLIITTAVFLGPAVCLATSVVPLAFYLCWMAYLLPRLTFSGERLSLRESMTTRARAHSAFMLGLMLISSLVLAGGGIALLFTDPRHCLLALFAIFFFGLCVANFTYMLMLRQRTTDVQG
jgi:hypothetical protein